MSQTLYLECYAGISGDMAVAALLDVGADQQVLEMALKSLPIDGFQIKISRIVKAGLEVCDFAVILDEKHANHDHDMHYLYGKENQQESNHMASEQVKDTPYKEQSNLEENASKHAHKVHSHRKLPEIFSIISRAEMTDKAKELARKIFTIIAEAEAKAHGVEVSEVHFHEVGAVDSIVDIVAVAVCIDNLDITEIVVPELYEGKGFVRCQHGVIPIPVPAVVNIAMQYHLKLHLTETEGELVTPTGAAIVAALRTTEQLPRQFSIQKIGLGSGKRTYDRPSILRAMLIQSLASEKEKIVKLETNIDDSSGEVLGFVMNRLLEAGAKDVYYLPIFMKKNRPAYQLDVICMEEDIGKLEQIIFEETTTIGIRHIQMERTVLVRSIKKIQTSLGEAQVKICRFKNENRIYPEYASVAKLCKVHGMSYQEIYHRIQKEAEQLEVLNEEL